MSSDMPLIKSSILLLGPALPLALAMALSLRPLRWVVIRLSPWSAVPALTASLVLPTGTYADLPWMLLQVRLGLDLTARVFLFFTALLWLLAGAYARTYLSKDIRQGGFFGFHLLSMSGNLGLILAQDMLSFYLFFALMGFSSYGLVIHNRTPEALRAGRVYIYLVVCGEVLLFSGLLLIAKTSGSLKLAEIAGLPQNNLTIFLVVFGFGIKAGALPLHVWLPLAHPAAPTPASAVLSGAMIKTGLLGWLRFLPLGQPAAHDWGMFLMVAGLLAAFYGVLVGLCQDNSKSVLAYSSISQMGIITVSVGIGLTVPAAAPLAQSVVLIYALHHAFAKGALFLGIGVMAAAGKDRRRRGLVTAGLLLAATALAGGPFTAGAVAKAAIKSAATSLPAVWLKMLSILLPLSAVGTTLLMARFLGRVRSEKGAHQELACGLWLPWAVTLACVGLVVWFWPEAEMAARKALSPASIWSALWPVGLGVFLACGFCSLGRKTGKRFGYRIPPGDLLTAMVWIAGIGRACLSEKLQVIFRRCTHVAAKFGVLLVKPLRSRGSISMLESRISTWPFAGLFFLGTICVLYLLLALD